ncbi:Uncharacterised protein [Vibrio cholerae]|nr:Uncharacterised protein [Vibrio cholerae]
MALVTASIPCTKEAKIWFDKEGSKIPIALLDDLESIAGARFSMYPKASTASAIFSRVAAATESGLLR